MSVIVQKYGGSSVADLTRIGRVADRVVAARRDEPHHASERTHAGKFTPVGRGAKGFEP